MTHALVAKAMVMNLSIGIWAGYRLDREATRRVTTEAGASADAARVNKHLIPKEALAPIVTAQNAIRTHFYSNTLPWRDNGDRLMTRKLFTTFIPEHEKLVEAFQATVEHFLNVDYPSAIEKAEFRMGSMFNRDDYPNRAVLRSKFYANLEIDAITTSGDFRVEIDQKHVDKVRAAMEEAAEKRLEAATADIWKRMADTVGHFQQRMADPKAVFRNSTINNINEMLDLVPGLNVLDDPKIEMIRAAIAKSFGNLDANDIRSDPDHRKQLASDAQEIMDKMSGFMNAFGGAKS